MTPEEQLAHLRDGAAWDLAPIRSRSLQTPRKPSAMAQIAVPVVVGLVIAAVVTIGVGAVRRGTQPMASPTATVSATALTPSQLRIAITTAKEEASGASPEDPGIKQPSALDSDSWPSYVTSVQAMANVTRAEASALTSSTTSDQTGVIVVRMTGNFLVEHSAPAGASSTTRGSTMVVVVDATTGQVLDFGVGSEDTYPPLANAAVIFARGDG